MDKFILVAMNRKNHTHEELDANRDAAAAAYDATYDADAYAAVTAAAYAYAAYTDDADAADDADAEYYINKYFKRTGEDKKTYINEIERINNMKTVMDIDYKYTGKTNSFFTNGRAYKVKPEGLEHITEDDTSNPKHGLSDDYLSKNFSRVFTQAMADNGELPVVGMECMIQFTKGANPEVCKVLSLYEDEAWVLLYDGMCTHIEKINDYTFTAIDTRTGKEKTIDEISYILDGMAKSNSNQETAEVLMHFILKNKLHGVKWVGE